MSFLPLQYEEFGLGLIIIVGWSLSAPIFSAIFSSIEKFEENLEFTFETSSGKLLAHEYVIIGVKAVWTKDGKENKDDPEGVLFLTDQRILFEQKEEVATKKFLFITKERERNNFV